MIASLRKFTRFRVPDSIVLDPSSVIPRAPTVLQVLVTGARPTVVLSGPIQSPEGALAKLLTDPTAVEVGCEIGLASSIAVDALLLAPLSVSVGPDVAGPRSMGKAYRPPVDPSIAQRVSEIERKRHIEAFKDAARRRTSAGTAIRTDLFELIKPILMPPLNSELGETILMPGELYDYQRYGVKWLMEEPGRLLADDMGLGKTAQAITAFRALVRSGAALNALVLCPASLVETWRREIQRWAPELNVFIMDGSEQARTVAWPVVRRVYHVVITTYDRLRNDKIIVERVTAGSAFSVLILDEVQYVKNRNLRRGAVTNVHADRRWGLSGTPLENSPEEFQTILELLLGKDVPMGSIRREAERHMLRRRKSDALIGLPELIRNKKYLELSASQRVAYDRAEASGVARLRADESQGLTGVLALITRLKQICNSVDGESCKTEFVVDYMDEVSGASEKALLFSQYKQHFDDLRSDLSVYRPLAFTGDLSPARREDVLNTFRSNPGHEILLMTLGAGGVGLTITEANHVIHYDSWWNPAKGSQATGRAHRIGQAKRVVETTLICSNTIEERIDAILQAKRHLFESVVDDLSDQKLARIISEDEFYGLFGLTAPRRQRSAVAQQPVPRALPGPQVIRPEEPYFNVLKLREILSACTQRVDWADPHFGVRALQELAQLSPAAVSMIRIVSLNRDNIVNEQTKSDYKRFKEQMKNRGITVEWRVTDERFHDRYIISEEFQYNVPPVNSIFQGAYAEMLPTPHPPPFERWFDSGREMTEAPVIERH